MRNLVRIAAFVAVLFPAQAFGQQLLTEKKVFSMPSYTTVGRKTIKNLHQLYNLEKDAGRIRAKVQFIPSKTDLIFPPELSRKWAERLRAQGNHTEVFELQGTSGHLDGLFVIGQAADTIRAFLDK